MENTMSPADYAAVSKGDGFGSDWLAMIFLFALIYGFGGNGFNNAIGYENLSTSAEVQRGFDNQNSMANQREILATSNSNALQEMQNNNQNTQYLMGAFNDKYNELQRDIAGVSMGVQQSIYNQQSCCCDIRSAIQETSAQQRYDSAMQTAQLQQAIQAEGAATRAVIQENKIEALQQQVNDLNLKLQMSGVARVPMAATYNAGPYPFCGCNGGYNI